MEHPVKDLPTCDAVRTLYPDIGCIDSSENLEPACGNSLAQDGGISHIVLNKGGNFGAPLLTVERGGTPLGDIAHAVELGGKAPVPEGMNRQAFP